MSRLVPFAAALATAIVAWLSQGTIAFTGTASDRVAVLPLSVTAVLLVVLAAAAVIAAHRRGASLAPLWLLGLPILPWLPVALPQALLAWSDWLGLVVWLAVAVSIALSLPRPRFRIDRPVLVAGALAFVLYAVSAWQVSPSIPGGDEPHYLVITQSLLLDRDLKIENNHRRGDYRSYFAGDLPPDFRVRGRNGAIYSIHAPGVSALVLPAFAVAGYHGVVLFLILLSSAGSALAWRLARRVTGRDDAAWFGWAAVTCSATSIFHSFTVYPDGPGGVVALTGLAALLRAEDESRNGSARATPWLLHGMALATMPWLHTRFVLIAASFGAVILLRLARTRQALTKAVAFLVVPAASAVCWFGYFVSIYGTPDPSVPYANEPGSIGFVPGGLIGLFFDQRFGLFAYAPVLVFAVGGLGVMLARRDASSGAVTGRSAWFDGQRRLALELLFVLVPYLLAVTHFAMWWGGRSAPARFFVPMLLLMAVPAAAAWTAIGSRATRATALGALVFTGFTSAVLVLVDGGRLAFNTRETYALWLEWANGTVDLGHGLPSWWRGQETHLYRDTAIWAGLLALAWAALRRVDRVRSEVRSASVFAAVAAAVYASAAMAALTIVWAVSGVAGVPATSAQLELLRRLGAERHLVAVNVGTWRRLAMSDVPPVLKIVPSRNTASGGAGPNDRPLYVLPAVPAGRYRLTLEAGGGDAWLMLGIGRDQFSIRSEALATPPQSFVLDFPVDVRAIIVRGDEQAQRTVKGIVIQPLALVPRERRLSDAYARHAVRYGPWTAYFLDDRSFPEPQAFWIAGASRATVVLQADAPRTTATLLIRNAPVENAVLIESGGWREELRLGPGEERRLQVPLDFARGATRLVFTASAGFRPSAMDPASRDQRFLGVWVRIED